MSHSRRLVSTVSRVACIAAALLVVTGMSPLTAQVSSSADYHRVFEFDAAPSPLGSLGVHAMDGRGQRPVPAYGYPARTGFTSHLAAKFGGGVTVPADKEQQDLTYGWDVLGGLGYNFDRHFSLMGEYQFDSNKIPAKILAQVGEPGGNVHIWSLTMNPVWNYKTGGGWGGYITGGGGYYRKSTSFTEPATVTSYYCDYFSCYPYNYVSNVVVSRFATNQGGVNIGGGFTFGKWSGAKLFTEARYNWIDTPGRGTKIVPVTLGLRW